MFGSSELPFVLRWFSLCTPVSSTNKTDRHDITEIWLKVALNTINLNLNPICFIRGLCFIYDIRIYLRMLVSNMVSISDDDRVV